jgi:DNA polymerase-1
MRLAAMWYKDEALKAICNDPTKDIHSNITAKAFRGDYEEIYTGYKNGDIEMTELRVAGKTVGFGVIYQEGEQALSYQLKIPVEKAKSFIDTFYSNFPDLKKNIELTKQLVIKQGFIDNYFGFRRAWKFHSEEDHKTQREAVNHPIQSLGFNMLELAMIDVDKIYEKENMKSELVLQVYDSLCTEAPEEEVDEVVHIMKETMQAVNKPFDGINDVMMKVDIKIGETLADF